MADLSIGGTTGREEKMTPYCWWVLFIGAASWLFDCMDQRIFVLSRTFALRDLLPPGTSDADINSYGEFVTAAMIVGWAVGGFFFGIVGDRWGRVRTLSTSILIYSLFTGLSGLSVTWIDFCVWRFLMGCGIGGAFATAATLIAETMPSRYRALALGSFQALSATGNVLGSLVSWYVIKPPSHYMGIPGWRVIFFFGVLPAFLIVIVMRTIKEPEAWHAARKSAKEQLDRQMGDLRSMFRHPRWRTNLIVGVMLSLAGVLGLWGIGFWTPELISEALTNSGITDPEMQNAVRSKGTLLQDVGSFTGMFFFTFLAMWVGRKFTFGLCFILCYAVVAFVFLNLETESQVYWMTPLVGFATLSVFGGYALYFPEIFPTRLRATGTGICYNAGRILAAALMLLKVPIKSSLGGLMETHEGFFESLGITSPFRAVAIVMCTIYVVGLIALIWAPETKGKPLPTDDD